MYTTRIIEGLKALDGHTALVLGPHCDDIPIGFGGTLCKMKREGYAVRRVGCVFTGGDDPTRRREEKEAGAAFGLASLDVLSYPDGQLPAHETAILRHLQHVRDE